MGTSVLISLIFIDNTDIKKIIIKSNTAEFSEYITDFTLKNIVKIKEKLRNGLPTMPTILSDELECNIFLKAKDVKSFSKLRDLKDNF